MLKSEIHHVYYKIQSDKFYTLITLEMLDGFQHSFFGWESWILALKDVMLYDDNVTVLSACVLSLSPHLP